MANLRISEIAQLTGLSMRHWQRKAAENSIPGVRFYESGNRRIYFVDRDSFVPWWERQLKSMGPCRKISGSGERSGGIASPKTGSIPHEGSLGTDNLRLAQERLQRVRQELTATKFGEKPRRTFDEAALRFAKEHFKHLKPKSRKRYAVSLANLTDHFQGVTLDDIGSSNFRRFGYLS